MMNQQLKIDSLYDEMRVMRDQLLNRIELLESDVELLTKENMDYAKELYQIESSLESRIDILLEELDQVNLNEGQEGSEEDYQEGEETSRMVY